jgi:flavin reductase (DIM6/NTAB) family NADH-FMN oxidoreductase RutF
MKTFYPKDHPIPVVHQLLLSGVAPRPIAFVGTVNKDGERNLSPFSFFNAFGANPPVICVSPANRGTDGSSKHTYANIMERGEFTVSAVSFSMVEQTSLASSNYAEGVDEFTKAGFTALESDVIAVPGVAESPFVMECKLMQAVELGGMAGSGNLLLGEVVAFHVRESVYTADMIDPSKLDLVARMGQSWYCRASGDALFQLPKPRHNGIGFDALPEHIRQSVVFNGNDLGKLAGIESLPDRDIILKKWIRDVSAVNPDSTTGDLFGVEIQAGNPREALQSIIRDMQRGTSPMDVLAANLQRCAQTFLLHDNIEMAWECAIMSDKSLVSKMQSK